MLKIQSVAHSIKSNEDYFAHTALNQTFLKRWRVCPYWAQKADIERALPEESTTSIEFGKAVDCAVTEPDEFTKRYAVVARRSKEMLEEGRNVVGKIELTQNEWNRVQDTVRGIISNPVFARLFNKSTTQKVVMLSFNGQPFKSKLDFFKETADRIVIADLKTCQNAAERQFRYAIVEYGYMFQMAFYRYMVRQERRLAHLTPARKSIDCYLIAADQSPKSAVYRIDPALLDEQEGEIRAMLLSQPWRHRVEKCECDAFGTCPFFTQSEAWEINKNSLLFTD